MATFREQPITNYVYLYHLDEWVLIPVYPESIADTMQSTFSSVNALSRTAPVFSYSNSGPRQVQVNLNLHRDLFNSENISSYSNLKVAVGEDYMDTLIKDLQAMALPKYQATSKSVVPPMVAVCFGEEIFIKGVINGPVSVTYKTPVLDNGKYAIVDISFQVSEVDPYDAETVSQVGSFRGLTRTFKNGIYKEDSN